MDMHKSILLLLLFFSPVSVFAHGLATAQQQVVGDYILEFEYDTPGQVVAGELTTYNFELLKLTDQSQVPFNRVFVKFTKPTGETVFSGNLTQVDIIGRLASRANVILPEVGPYSAELNFYNNNEKLASGTFPFDVRENTAAPKPNWFAKHGQLLVLSLLGLVVVAESVLLAKKRLG